MSTDHEGVRVLLGAYVLGGLDAGDRRLLEDHLSTCAACRDELARSAALPGLLRRRPGVGSSEAAVAPPAPSPQLLPALLARARAERTAARRRAAVRWASAAAAAVVAAVLVTGAVLGLDGGSPADPGASAPAQRTVVLTAEGGGARGSAQLSTRAWGTALALELTALPDAGPFTLEVTGADGTRQSGATWGTTPTGEAQVSGATSLAPEEIESIAVVGADGAVLTAEVTGT